MAKKNLKYQSPGINEETRFEKLHTVNFENSQEASRLIAREICDLVKSGKITEKRIVESIDRINAIKERYNI